VIVYPSTKERAMRIDPEKHEIEALARAVGTFGGKRVLEVGCGDGRLTWRYARGAASVLAIDPDRDLISIARDELPPGLDSHVELRPVGIEELNQPPASFDVAIMSWSL
jgi:2-polyprenyl-3-methyl-5-hydroxy-6-metoxy-1,4-benzoquinol methylase